MPAFRQAAVKNNPTPDPNPNPNPNIEINPRFAKFDFDSYATNITFLTILSLLLTRKLAMYIGDFLSLFQREATQRENCCHDLLMDALRPTKPVQTAGRQTAVSRYLESAWTGVLLTQLSLHQFLTL